MTAEDAIQFADDRPTSCDQDLYQWAVDAEEVIRELVRAVSRSRPPSTAEPSCEALADFQEGQWWVNELDAIASHPLGARIYVTADMKRAVAVVHHLLRSARKHEQPSPTPQADSQPAPVLDRARIREIFMAHGFTVKEGQTDLKQYVYDAADALLRAARAPADSVTAPAGGVVAVPRETLRAWRQWCAQSMSHAIEHEISDFLAAPPTAQAGGWTKLPGQLPEPGMPVLLDIGKKYPIRAMWAAKHTVEAADDDTDWGEYDEATDTYYCPEGWYEWNEHEDTNWAVSATPRAWTPLPPTNPAGSGKGE